MTPILIGTSEPISNLYTLLSGIDGVLAHVTNVNNINFVSLSFAGVRCEGLGVRGSSATAGDEPQISGEKLLTPDPSHLTPPLATDSCAECIGQSAMCKGDDVQQSSGEKLLTPDPSHLTPPLATDSCAECLALAVSQYIVSNMENRLVKKAIDQNYGYFQQNDRAAIYKKALYYTHLADGATNSAHDRVHIIKEKVQDFLATEQELIIEGFVTFRLKDYLCEISALVDCVVEEFMIEREYGEFIDLLKSFVDAQQPKLALLNIIASETDFVLKDENGADVTHDCTREVVHGLGIGASNVGDLLMSTLISTSPQQIRIHCVHNFKNKELIATIKNVFSGRVTVCYGCAQCDSVDQTSHIMENLLLLTTQ